MFAPAFFRPRQYHLSRRANRASRSSAALKSEAARLELRGSAYRALTPAPYPSSLCAACGKPGDKKCGCCKALAYCGSDCQAAHWKREGGHKGSVRSAHRRRRRRRRRRWRRQRRSLSRLPAREASAAVAPSRPARRRFRGGAAPKSPWCGILVSTKRLYLHALRQESEPPRGVHRRSGAPISRF